MKIRDEKSDLDDWLTPKNISMKRRHAMVQTVMSNASDLVNRTHFICKNIGCD